MRSAFRAAAVTLGALTLALGAALPATAHEGDDTTCHAMTDEGTVVALPINVCSDLEDTLNGINDSNFLSVEF